MSTVRPTGTAGGTAVQAEAAHPTHLAHHFETPRQQFESGKTGMWLFLSTEVLLFSGLFCAYSVYRSNHPEIFVYAHQFLDKTLGAVNTLILILSSLTAAWAVRAAQLGQRRKLILLITATLVCACGFLGVKGVEYEHKWKHGLLWGRQYHPRAMEELTPHKPAAQPWKWPMRSRVKPTNGSEGAAGGGPATAEGGAGSAGSPAGGGAAAGSAPGGSETMDVHTNIPPAADGPAGLARAGQENALGGLRVKGDAGEIPPSAPRNVQIFFSIYFIMTGLHGLHVLAGMGAFTWVLRRAVRGDFSSDYFTPVDLVALYWHLVDLIWIYLFPLLYLIH